MASGHQPKHQSRVTEHLLSESSSPEPSSGPQHRITLFDRFGLYAITSILVGSLVILGALGFISFLWIGDVSNPVWQRIVLAGWTPRSITIASLLLRWAVAAQAAVCTSMIAALFLALFQMPLPKAAAVSLIRFSNTGPHSFLVCLPGHLRTRSVILGLLVTLMTMVTLLLQFTSTALLSDVGTDMITVAQTPTKLPYGIESGALLASQVESIGYLGTKPAVYPAFAEYADPAPAADGTRDTGLSIRGFLPIEGEQSRDLLRNYSGMATLIDTRVVCMRPKVSNIKISASLGDPTIAGSISTAQTPTRFNRTSTIASETDFNCNWAIQSLFTNFYAPIHEWPLAMCKLNITDSGLISAMDSLILPAHVAFNPGDAFLLINSTGSFSEWGSAGADVRTTHANAKNEWLEISTTTKGLSLQLTLCYTNNVVQDALVQAWRPSKNSSEAVSGWNNETGTFETLEIRRQLGATRERLSDEQRNIFSLEKKASWERPPSLLETPTGWTSNNLPTIPDLLTMYAKNGMLDEPVMLCGYCQPGGRIKTARVHSAVFSAVLKDTGDPALALQGLITTLFGMSYYDHLFQFDVRQSAETVSEVAVLKPTGWKFFIAVVALVALHLMLVVVVTGLFIFKGGNSLLGNAWSAVAQLQGEDTAPWVSVAGNMTDRGVAKAMRAAGEGSTLVGVAKSDGQLRLRKAQ